jgi:hypothetical protein
MPSFRSFRDNIRPSEKPTPYEDELGDMQDAILSGNVERMSPQERIVPKPDFAPEEQIDRYIKGYRYRLFDLVYDDYPALLSLWGKKKTDTLIREYVEATPSTHFNISRYVERFPEYVRDNASPFAYELCVLETALSRIFDAQESQALTQDDLAGLTPESFMEMELKPRDALKLFAFSYPVNKIYQAHLNGKNISDPEKETSFLAVFRHNDTLWRLDLEEREYMVLSSLFAGLSVGEALSAAISDDDETAFSAIGEWFSKWMSNGLLAKAA